MLISTDKSALLWMYCREIAPFETPTFSTKVGELIGRATKRPSGMRNRSAAGASMPQPIVGNSDLRFSDAYAILKSQEPALPYDLDPRFNDPVICTRVGEVIARAMILPSRPAWKSLA
jgi:hypothetical protein